MTMRPLSIEVGVEVMAKGRRKSFLRSCIFATGLVLVSVLAEAGAAGNGEWSEYGLDSSATRDSPLTQIDATNVAHLGLAWAARLADEHSTLEGTPLEIDGVLYANGGTGSVYAFDARTGRVLWTYVSQPWRADPRGIRGTFASNRGLAYWNDVIYTCTEDGRMVALDAKTGNVLWSTHFIIPGTYSLSTGAPRFMDGLIIIGSSGDEAHSRGYVTAVNARTGRIAWRFFTVPGNPAKGFETPAMQMAAKTWKTGWWKHGGGGPVWNAITYDRQLHQVYIGAGNPIPWSAGIRGDRDDLFTDSIVALDVRTGRYLWHYQTTPDDEWDFDATADMVLTTLRIHGHPQKVLMQANKNGFFYVIDRVNGKLLSADKYALVNWAAAVNLKTGRPMVVPGSRYSGHQISITPSVLGAHDWQAMSYNAALGLVYIPVIRAVSVFRPEEAAPAQLDRSGGAPVEESSQEASFVVRPMSRDGDCGAGRDVLEAWNPITRKVAWSVAQPCQFNGGTLTTAGNLVFQGLSNGYLNAYSADKGRLLWSFYARMGFLAPPITYSVDGKQYIAILAGYGGGAGVLGSLGYPGWVWGMPRWLLTFRLGGAARMPSGPRPMTDLKPLDDPALKLDPTEVAAGAALYEGACSECHGESVVANGNAPDLRAAPLALNRLAFGQVLRKGRLISGGMPLFDDMSGAQIDDLYAYIRWVAREDRKKGRNGVDAVLDAAPR